jgi:KDO2-lipid IV(A) lauroyltransferase
MKPWYARTRKKLSRLSLIALTGFFRLLGHILPYRVAVGAGGLLGTVAYVLIPRDRKRAIANLLQVFPERGSLWARRTARKTFIHLGKALMETVAMTRTRLASVVAVRGLENLQAALALGKGVVYFTGHIGNWELMAAKIGLRYPVSVVAAPLEPAALNDMIVDIRAAMGVQTIVRSMPGAARDLIRVFRQNRVLGILIDQDTDVEGTFVDFLGRPAWTPTAAAQMAAKFGAAAVFGFTHRERTGRHTVTIVGPLTLVKTGNDDEDIRANTASFTKMIEEAVLMHPEQWVWMHRRWRTQP